MTNEHTKAMVLRDSEGNYYLLPLAVMERARIPAERVAEVEAAIGEVTAYAMGSAVGGGILEMDGSFLVDEEVESWPVVETRRGAGIISAMRMIAGSRF
jgi:hypothetical protein